MNEPQWRWHILDELARDRSEGATPPRTRLLHRRFWLNTPWFTPLCRLLGHRDVVDGTRGFRGEPGSRWVCCDRCGERRFPQGHLDPALHNIGRRYSGPVLPEPPAPLTLDEIKSRAASGVRPGWSPPGPYPPWSGGVLGGELLVGKSWNTWGFEVKVGNKGSEQDLAGSIHLGNLGVLYLHTERHGNWLVRRLNPTGYTSRRTGIDLHFEHGARLSWKLWSGNDCGNGPRHPRWRDGSVDVSPLDRLLGPKRYTYTDVGPTQDVTVRMPHGDDHTVQAQLQHQTHGRARQFRRPAESWMVSWDADGDNAIPTKPGERGRVTGSGVRVSARSVRDGTWQTEAAANIATSMTEMRTRYGYSRWHAEEAA